MLDDTPRAPRFAGWLSASMASRGLSQAQLARSVGVADTQVSRWRRGQVIPTVQYLQRLADAFGVDRAVLDRLVGLPVAQAGPPGGGGGGSSLQPELEAELRAHAARLDAVLRQRLPPSMWRAYVEACVALADGLSSSAERLERLARQAQAPGQPAETEEPYPPPDRPLGFRS